jgi:hypothetical protein
MTGDAGRSLVTPIELEGGVAIVVEPGRRGEAGIAVAPVTPTSVLSDVELGSVHRPVALGAGRRRLK